MTIREDEEYSSTTRIQGQVPLGASGSGVKECNVVAAVDVGSTHHLKDNVLLFHIHDEKYNLCRKILMSIVRSHYRRSGSVYRCSDRSHRIALWYGKRCRIRAEVAEMSFNYRQQQQRITHKRS